MTRREKIREKFGGLCAYTGKPLGDDWQIDHIAPRRLLRWKKNIDVEAEDNLVPCLRTVNYYKRGFGLEGFRKYIMKINERIRGMKKKDGTYRKNMENRCRYVERIAEAFGITDDAPFDGVFYFERHMEKKMEQVAIGVIPLWDEERDSIWMLPGYTQGIEEAGAVPVILNLTASEPALKHAVCSFDGFLFTGGQDVNPKLYGQEKSGRCGEVCDIRDRMEAYIFREAVLNQNKPALGICRGIQFINVLLGGSLYQDIPTELPSAINHAQKAPYDVPAHSVSLVSGSPLRELAGKERLNVNSSHHQGINRVAEGLKVMAAADDGLVEAVYKPDHPYLWAVQWHPEFSLNDETSRKIFSSFVRSVEESARR
jgi:putative glutamine amidotransferase